MRLSDCASWGTATRCGSCSRTSATPSSGASSVVDRANRAALVGRPNPALSVQTLVLDDGRALAESNAILWYFGDGTRYVPPMIRFERAQVFQWDVF